MRDEDKLMECDAEKILELTKKTYENNLLKFVVLFGEDGYFLGTMRNGDEAPGRTIDELIRITSGHKQSIFSLRIQDNGPYFFGVIKTKTSGGKTSISFNVHRPEDDYITLNEYENFKRFIDENMAIVGDEKCDIKLGEKTEDLEGLVTEMACSISPSKDPTIIFANSNLSLRKNP